MSAASDRPADRAGPEEWYVRVRPSFIGKQKLRSPLARLTLMQLDWYARDRAYCWPSVPTLMRDLDVSQSAMRGTLVELERQGFIRAVTVPNRGRRSIIGWILIERPDPRQPVASTLDLQDAAKSELVRRHEAKKNGAPRRAIQPRSNGALDHSSNGAPQRAGINPHLKQNAIRNTPPNPPSSEGEPGAVRGGVLRGEGKRMPPKAICEAKSLKAPDSPSADPGGRDGATPATAAVDRSRPATRS